MSENLSAQELQRAAELANLANQVYQDNGGKPEGGWEKVITSAEVPAIIDAQTNSGYYGAVYRKPDGTYDSNGNSNYEYALVHRGTNDWKDFFVDLGVGFDLFPQDQFKDASKLLNQAKSLDPKFSEAVSHGEVANVGHSLGGLLAKLFGAAMGSNEIVAYNSPGGSHLLNDAAKYWDQINHNATGTTNLTNKDYSNIVKEINAWGDPVSKIGGFGIGKEYDLSQGQSLLGNLLLDNPFSEAVGSILGAKTFHSMDNLEDQLNGDAQKLINDTKTKNAPLNSDGTINFNLINNSQLNLTINTDLKSNFRPANDPTQMGNAIDGGDYVLTAPILNLNGDGAKNVVPYGMVTDNYRPGNNELSAYANFNTQLNVDFAKIDNINNQINQNLNNNSLANLQTQLQNPLANIANESINARNFINIDPVVLDLNGDGVELIAFKDSKVSFDVDNDGYKENTGWVKGADGILVEDKNHNGKIDDITETISEHYTRNHTRNAGASFYNYGLANFGRLFNFAD